MVVSFQPLPMTHPRGGWIGTSTPIFKKHSQNSLVQALHCDRALGGTGPSVNLPHLCECRTGFLHQGKNRVF